MLLLLYIFFSLQLNFYLKKSNEERSNGTCFQTLILISFYQIYLISNCPSILFSKRSIQLFWQFVPPTYCRTHSIRTDTNRSPERSLYKFLRCSHSAMPCWDSDLSEQSLLQEIPMPATLSLPLAVYTYCFLFTNTLQPKLRTARDVSPTPPQFTLLVLMLAHERA